VKFPLYSPGGTEQNAAFHSVCPAAGGGIWAGSDVGLFRFDGSRFTYYGTNAGLPVLWLKHVFEATNGDLYLADGAQNVEIFRDGKLVARFKCPTWPTGFAEDKLGVVTGSGDHLFRVNPDGLTPYAFTNATPDFGWIHSLNSTRDGTILVAGGNGVFRVKDGDFERFSTTTGLPVNEAQWVCEDSSNVLWAGLAGGVARIEGNHVDSWTQDNGLSDNYVRAIIPDDKGWLWFHSGNGFFRARRDSFMVGGHKAERLHFEIFDGTDDVKTLETADVEFSACKTHDGHIWIPSPQGIILIDPARLPPTPALPAVHIETIRINGKEWPRAARFLVPPGRGELEVQYTAPTFIAPQLQQFRYRLEGYETKWESVGTRRSAFFTNLKPGKYKFLVQACDADGLAGGPSDSVEMELLPFFYQTIWFYFVCAGLGLSVLSGIYAWRVSFLQRKQRQMQATQECLEEEVQHRTADLTRANAALREENVERQRAEASLVSSREEFKDLFDNAPVGFHEVDAEGRLVRVNYTELKMQGYTAGELLGQFVWKLSADGEAARQNVLAILREKRPAPQNVAQMFRRKDGSTFPVMLNARLLRREDGAIAGIRSAIQDITGIKETEAKLEQAHKELLETSRLAGMAEIATNVLHNIGNVLNSVNVSASLVVDNVKQSRVTSLAKVAALLREHEHDLGTFITRDAKGRQLPAYLSQLVEQLLADQKAAIIELELLVKNIEHINEVVAMQQSHARVSGVREIINVRDLMEDSLRMNEAGLHRHQVEVVREYAEVPLINVDKHRVLQILVNLIRNAKHACQDSGRGDKQITVRVANGEGRIKISVHDNGVGISPENLARIFNHGFTTRKDGHGFGLHSGALAAKEMGGTLKAHSDGPGKGACFTLELPVQAASTT
jgi:PAS domain S-box-containing protein